MPKITVEVPHRLGQEEAIRRLKDHYRGVMDRYQGDLHDFEEHWEENSFRCRFRVVGMKIEAAVAAEPAAVRAHASLPLAAMIFKAAIEKRLREELEHLLV